MQSVVVTALMLASMNVAVSDKEATVTIFALHDANANVKSPAATRPKAGDFMLSNDGDLTPGEPITYGSAPGAHVVSASDRVKKDTAKAEIPIAVKPDKGCFSWAAMTTEGRWYRNDDCLYRVKSLGMTDTNRLIDDVGGEGKRSSD